jgi:hypothetical protein
MHEVMLTKDASSQRPTICRVGDAGFAAMWTDTDNARVFGHRLSGDGLPVGDEFRVTAADAFGNSPVSTAAGDTDRPGFAVAWMRGNAVAVRFLDPEGQGGAPNQVNLTDASIGTTPAIAQLADGSHRLVVAWVLADGGLGARLLSPTGQPLGAEIIVSGAGTVVMDPIRAIAVDTGHFVLLWQGAFDTTTHTATAMRREYTPDGLALGPAGSALLFAHTGDLAACAIHSPPESGDPADYMVAHQVFATSDASGPIAPERLILATGRRVGLVGGGPTFNVTRTAEHTVAHGPATAPLSGRRFITTWASRSVVDDGTGENVRAAVCVSRSHPPRPVSFPVSESTAGNQTHPRVATGTVAGAERMAFVWLDDSATDPASDVRAIKTRVLDPTQPLS